MCGVFSLTLAVAQAQIYGEKASLRYKKHFMQNACSGENKSRRCDSKGNQQEHSLKTSMLLSDKMRAIPHVLQGWLWGGGSF